MIVKAPVGAMAGPTLVGPAVCGEVPVRSTVIASSPTIDAGADGERLEPLRAALEVRLVQVLAVAEGADGAPHAGLGAVHQLGDRRADGGRAVAGGQRLDALGGLPAGADHGLVVALALAGPAHVGEDAGRATAWFGPAAIDDPDRRDAHAFLEDLGGAAGEAPRAHAADVAPVGADDREHEEAAVRGEERDRSWRRR